jgi:hypothetical protein
MTVAPSPGSSGNSPGLPGDGRAAAEPTAVVARAPGLTRSSTRQPNAGGWRGVTVVVTPLPVAFALRCLMSRPKPKPRSSSSSTPSAAAARTACRSRPARCRASSSTGSVASRPGRSRREPRVGAGAAVRVADRILSVRSRSCTNGPRRLVPGYSAPPTLPNCAPKNCEMWHGTSVALPHPHWLRFAKSMRFVIAAMIDSGSSGKASMIARRLRRDRPHLPKAPRGAPPPCKPSGFSRKS